MVYIKDDHQVILPMNYKTMIVPSPQTRRAFVHFINYRIKSGTPNARKRSGKSRTTRTSRFISLVRCNVENKKTIDYKDN